MLKQLILSTLALSWCVEPGAGPVAAPAGAVRGAVGGGGKYAQYTGIPYARVAQRFQDPQPVPPWPGVFNAVEQHVRCPQRFPLGLVLGREDCLTLNVFTPLAPAPRARPVMVFIHGGGFREGSNTQFFYGPDYLIDKDVVVVTINYRVEILGFLCLGIKEAPGNMGLKDQVAALKWVKRNIVAFGGDPDNVTVFGESAGAAAVSYLMLSPMAKGLFHKAIMQSGTAITPWSFQYDPLETAISLAGHMDFHSNDPHKLYNFFKNKTVEELLKARVPREEGNLIMSETIFVPCVEKPIPGVEPFLTDYPYNIYEKGVHNDVPTMLGYNTAEGYMFLGKENDTTIAQLDLRKAMPRDLKFPTQAEKEAAADKARELYLAKEDVKITKKNLHKLVGFYGDPFFKYPVIATTELMLKTSKSSVYNYRFAYDGWLNLAKFIFGYGSHPGVSHADDLFYLFKPKFPVPAFLESKIIDQVTTMWTNFAKFGQPIPATSALLPRPWPRTAPAQPEVFVIDREATSAPLVDSEATSFWRQTYSKYRRNE